MTTYRSAPFGRSVCLPARSFPTPLAALRFAQDAAEKYRTVYGVFRSERGRLTHLRTFAPNPIRA